MKTIELNLENGTSLFMQAHPKEHTLLISAQNETEHVQITTNIDEVRDLYEALPGLLIYYSSRVVEDV